jgi:hypothetical protein
MIIKEKYTDLKKIIESSGFTRNESIEFFREANEEDLEKAIQNIKNIENPEEFGRYNRLVRIVYGKDVALSIIMNYNPKIDLYNQLDIARREVYQTANESAASSGNIPFNIGSDL